MTRSRGYRALLLDRRFSIPAEAGIVAGILVVWQAARIPLEGSTSEALVHAHEWLSLQHALGLTGVQSGVISLVHHPVLIDVARLSYDNLHVFAIFTLMVALRAAAPQRYPRVRTAFVALHIPALIAIGVFPLASPFWLPHPHAWAGGAPALTGSLSADLRNQTATVASEHFGYPVLIAAGTLSAARWRPVALAILLYPMWVFLFIVGIGRHYPLDAVVGALCVAFGFAAAWLLHRGLPPTPATRPEPPRRWVALAIGFGLLGGWADGISSGRIHLGHPSALSFVAPAAAALAFIAVRAHRSAPAAPLSGYDRRTP